MKPETTIHLPSHPAVERIRRFRLMYAIGVHAGALLIVAAVFVALQVREIRTIAQLEITPVAAKGVSSDKLSQAITDCIRNAASDETLNGLLGRCLAKQENDGAALRYSAADLDRLRQRMAFAVLPVPDSQSFQVSLVLSGTGNQIESALVESFLAQIGDEVAVASSGPRKPKSDLIAESQYQALVSRRNDLLDRANDQLQDANSRIVSLAQDVITIADQASQMVTTESTNDRDGVAHNPFMQASFVGENGLAGTSAAATWRERFTDIPLSDLSNTFAEIEKSWNESLRPLGDLVAEQNSYQAPVVMRATRRGETMQIPFGMKPTREWLLLAMAAALAFGCVLASGVDLRCHDPGLGTAEEIEKSLGVPVLGQIRPAAGGTSPIGRHWSVRILKLNELIVFTTLLAILVVSIGSSDIRSTLVENPLHAVAKILWQVRTLG